MKDVPIKADTLHSENDMLKKTLVKDITHELNTRLLCCRGSYKLMCCRIMSVSITVCYTK